MANPSVVQFLFFYIFFACLLCVPAGPGGRDQFIALGRSGLHALLSLCLWRPSAIIFPWLASASLVQVYTIQHPPQIRHLPTYRHTYYTNTLYSFILFALSCRCVTDSFSFELHHVCPVFSMAHELGCDKQGSKMSVMKGMSKITT